MHVKIYALQHVNIVTQMLYQSSRAEKFYPIVN